MERRIIGELQHDLPINSRPYAAVAARLGISEAELFGQVKAMLAKGVIRKVGAVLRHRQVGVAANALCVWQVPGDRVEAVGEMFASLPAVTHCYERQTHPDWPYNLYTMVHATTQEACEANIGSMRDASGVANCRVFYSTAELKKTSMQYFG